jgi:putative hydrolases of HD superfamily
MTSPNAADLDGILGFLRAAERLKSTVRSGYTAAGDQESVAEHTWRLCLMAMLLAPEFPDVDVARLLRICIVHDLGEAVGGDIPAPEQARRLEVDPTADKSAQERADLLALVAPLPAARREEIVALWDEYEAAATPRRGWPRRSTSWRPSCSTRRGATRATSTTASISATAGATHPGTR